MDYSRFCAVGTTYTHEYVPGDIGVELLQVHFSPGLPSQYPPVIFLAGWASLIYSWEIVLREMTKDFEVYYVETREKSSAIHLTEQPLKINTLVNDLPSVLSNNKLTGKPYIFFGSSLGATVILDAMSKKKADPTIAILIGPNAEFNAPWYWLMMTRLTPFFLYPILKPAVKWYMKKKYLDMNSDPKQYEKYSHSLDKANIGRLRRSALNFSSYKIWEKLSNIHQKVFIFTGSKDVMHGYENTLKMVELLPNCKLVDLKTNARTHSIEMVGKMRVLLKEYANV